MAAMYDNDNDCVLFVVNVGCCRPQSDHVIRYVKLVS
jgi:hypothetical protein